MRVVELATFIAGPFAGQLLADMGADVVKVEQPGQGDPFRNFAGGLYGPHFVAYNRNKRSIAVDTRPDAGKQIVRRLLERADVFLENFRPGVMARMGLDYHTVREWNPRLIYCSVTGFGQSGPYRDRPSYDGVGQGLSGLTAQLVDPDRPRIVGPAFSDCITGMTAANAILAAWVARDKWVASSSEYTVALSRWRTMSRACHRGTWPSSRIGARMPASRNSTASLKHATADIVAPWSSAVRATGTAPCP